MRSSKTMTCRPGLLSGIPVGGKGFLFGMIASPHLAPLAEKLLSLEPCPESQSRRQRISERFSHAIEPIPDTLTDMMTAQLHARSHREPSGSLTPQ